MKPNDVVFSLGSYDPEMRSIRYMLGKTGFRSAIAMRFGRRCSSSNAYKADELSKNVRDDKQIIWVECRSSSFKEGRDVIVDHHNEGDPGYDACPNDYWEGSSIGQVALLVGGKQHEFKNVAAGDHCLSAAMRGECRGIDPNELMSWRIDARAAMAELPAWRLRKRIDHAVERIDTLPRLNFGGELIVDGSFDITPELRDAAAIVGLPIMTTRINPIGQVKVGLYGARTRVVIQWMDTMKASGICEDLYGNPHREFAGAVFTAEASAQLLSGRRAYSTN